LATTAPAEKLYRRTSKLLFGHGGDVSKSLKTMDQPLDCCMPMSLLKVKRGKHMLINTKSAWVPGRGVQRKNALCRTEKTEEVKESKNTPEPRVGTSGLGGGGWWGGVGWGGGGGGGRGGGPRRCCGCQIPGPNTRLN